MFIRSALIVPWIFVAVLTFAGTVLAQDVNVTGKWVGSATVAGGQALGVEMALLTQAGAAVSGTIGLRGRPAPPKDYDSDIKGKIDGNNMRLEYYRHDSRVVVVTLTLSSDGTLRGRAQVLGDSASTSGTLELKRAQ